MTSKAANDVVGKLAIEVRGPFRIMKDHSNGYYSMQPFNKPDSAISKFMAQDLYALPPQIFPCDEIDLPDFCYLNSYFSPIKHPFKDTFNIESCNSMWLADTTQTRKTNLTEICKELSLVVPPVDSSTVDPPTINKTAPAIALSPPPTPRPDTIDEMNANLPDDISSPSPSTCKPIDTPLQGDNIVTTEVGTIEKLMLSGGKLCFISYRGVQTIMPKWYLMQVRVDGTTDDGVQEYSIDFFRKYPDDSKKKDNVARY